MEPHSGRQQYTFEPLSEVHENASHDQGRTAASPEVIELENVPLADSAFVPTFILPRRGSSDSLTSVASSQKQAAQTPRANSLPDGTWIERRVKRLDESLKRTQRRTNARLSQSRFYGWRMGVLSGACMSAFVLCANIGMAIYGSATKEGYENWIADLRTGPAAEMARWSTTFHLFINAFSTMLLAASNYTMQVLSSPTRADIDRFHREGQWFDIGILSFRNLRRIPRQRVAMALLLAFSSIPLHLFYNASIFQIATFNEYGIAVIQNGTDKWQDMDKDAAFRNASSKYEKFIGSAWQSVYNVKYVAENEDLYLVVDRFAFNVTQDWVNIDVTKYFNRHRAASNQGLLREILYESSDWIRYEAFYDNQTAKDWPVSAHVDHAFSRKKVGNSRLQLSLVYILVVIACNALKLSIMIWTLIIDRSAYIVTLGDGVASFLQHPDPVTRSHCMLGKEEMLYKLGYMPYHELEGEELDTFNLRVDGVWLPQRRRFFALMGQDRQIFFAVLFCCVLSACIILPFTGRASSGYSMMRAWGTDSEDVLPFGSGLLLNAWLVNLPQIILSFCYLALNAICTSMASAQEWNNVAHTRKGLRVTRPFAEQRSTYFLQLPYRWAVPLIVTSGILHWLLSQSFFLVRLNVVNASNVVVESQTASGYARLSLLVFFAVALILMLAIGSIGLRHTQQRIPMAASCSLVISAACHPSNNQARDLHLKKVKWGVVDETVDNGYAHCSITAGSLKKVKVGQKYR